MPASPEESFRSLYAATYPDVLAFARRRVGDHDGHDIAAEVYAMAWRRLGEVPVDDARPWLFAVARKVLLSTARSQRRRGALAVRIASQPDAGVAGALDDLAVARADLTRAWAQLSADEQ